jgi:tetraacyldisaccharide 4'-kinase
MKAPAFWDRPVGVAALALWPIGLAVGCVDALKQVLSRPARVSVPVLCVGNPTVGGAGKTPTVIALIARLKSRGEQPFVLTRGHGGSVQGPHRVRPEQDTAFDVGDEPVLIAAHAPVIVDRDRARGARLAVAEGASIIIMDDGMQNYGLAKNATVAVIDGASGFGNGLVTPAGPLRGFLSMAQTRIALTVLIGDGACGDAAANLITVPIVRARLAPAAGAQIFAGQRVFAYCGIGRPEKFRRTLEEIGAEVVGFRAFPDHHVFSPRDVEALLKDALESQAQIVTTEKDRVRLLASPHGRAVLAGLSNVIPIVTEFDNVELIDALLDRLISARRSEAGA